MDKHPASDVTEWYDTLSPSYDELYGSEQERKHSKLLEHLGLQSLSTLLDIGCGTGTFLGRAAGLYDYAIGIDLSRGMLNIAKTRRLLKQDLVQAALPFLPIKNASVDCTVSISTSKGDWRLSRSIAEIERVNRNNATMAITILEPPEQKDLPTKSKVEYSYRINSRETLYILKIRRSTRNVASKALGEFKN